MDNGLTTFDTWILGIALLLISFGSLMGMLTVFQRLRRFAGMALMITAIMLGVTVWLIAADTVISGWTGTAGFRIIGVLVGIIVPLPMAPLIYLIHGDWGNVGFFLALYALIFAGWAGGVKASDAAKRSGLISATEVSR
jgi:hypothetical protein